MSKGINSITIEKALENFQIQFDALMRLYTAETRLLYESTSVESFCYCEYCCKDLYSTGLDDAEIKKIQYCPYCGAKIIRGEK